MGARSTARDAALQMLFALELSENGCDSVISDFWREFPGDPEDRAYADDITRGVDACLDELDTVIRQASEHWRLERMTRVDRNVLRLGSWELLKPSMLPSNMAARPAAPSSTVCWIGSPRTAAARVSLAIPWNYASRPPACDSSTSWAQKS